MPTKLRVSKAAKGPRELIRGFTAHGSEAYRTNCIFGVVSFVCKSLLGIERERNLSKSAIFSYKAPSRVIILIYRTWHTVMLKQ